MDPEFRFSFHSFHLHLGSEDYILPQPSIQEGEESPKSIVQPTPLELDLENAAPVRTKLRVAAILTALYLSLFVAALDQTIVATAIPVITASLHSSSGYFWIGAAYLIANAAAAPIWAKFSDIWGRKLALLSAVLVFASGSLMAALSVDMKMLLAARTLQGTAGGGLIQLVNITISDLFSMRSRSLWLGLAEMMWALAGGLGPILGGAFTELVSWRWCFWINLPISGSTFILLLLFLDVHNPRTRLREGLKAIDWFGTFSILGVVLMLLLGLDFGGATFPWSSPTVICLIVFGSLCLIIFVFSEKKLAKYPLMPLELFRNWSTNAAFAVCFCHGMVFIVSEYYLPLYFQAVKSASPLHSGVLILTFSISAAGTGITAGILIHQTGHFRELIWIGMCFLTLGTGLYIYLDRTTSTAVIVVFELLEGIGAGLLFEAPMIAVQTMASQADTATATATIGLIRNIATSMGIVLGGVVFQNSMDTRIPQLQHSIGMNQTLTDAFSHGQAAANVELIHSISDIAQKQAIQDAFAWSLRNMWIMFVAISAAGLVFSAFIVHKDLSEEHTETRTGIHEMTHRERGSV